MEVKEALRAALQELILPELDHMRRSHAELKAQMETLHKRLDDVNAHLLDQSRRIDALREEFGRRIHETNTRIDRLYEVVVRREEHETLEQRLRALERDVAEIKRRVA